MESHYVVNAIKIFTMFMDIRQTLKNNLRNGYRTSNDKEVILVEWIVSYEDGFWRRTESFDNEPKARERAELLASRYLKVHLYKLVGTCSRATPAIGWE